MKILWITNTLFPDVCSALGIQTPAIEGWLFSAAHVLLEINPDIKLAVATPYQGDDLKKLTFKGVTYFLVPISGSNGNYSSRLESYWKDVRSQFLPDVVHIQGTEYPHGLAYIKACGKGKVVVSIQGLVNVCQRYYYGGIEKIELLKNITIRDCLKLDTIFNQRNQIKKRGVLERALIQSVDHVIGRTSWDRSHIWEINSKKNYYFCNETLRSEFYNYVWDINSCNRNSIFISQAYYPLKGLHQVIKALPIILNHYPDAKVYVAGNDFLTNKGWRLNGFGKYIRSIMDRYGVTEKIIFTGLLSEKEMCNRYLASHVFVCPSSIENSSNSIGEAQLLGVPCVASYVGGVTDMITDKESGLLYRFEEFEMLAAAVCEIFANDFLAKNISKNSIKVAAARHDRGTNSRTLNAIYQTIYKN